MYQKSEIEIVTDFLELLNSVDEKWEQVCADISRADLERSDILHELELEDFDQQRGYELALDTKRVCKERRTAKDKQDLIRYLKDFSDKNDLVKGGLQRTLNQMNKVVNGHPSRKYTPRIRTAAKETPLDGVMCNLGSLAEGSQPHLN